MAGLMKEINSYINSTFQMIVLLLLLALICFILILLYYRFNHFGKRVNFPMSYGKNENKLCPKDWESQMQALAAGHKNVRLIRYSFVLDDYNQIAYKKLNKIRDRISELSTDIISLIPAARWLFDNFQMMYREIKKVRTSGTSYAILPILKGGELGGFPRIYVVAKKMVSLSQGHLSDENIEVMLKAYQQEIPLTDKEIWVLPEMLGFCLLENIIGMAEEIIHIIDVKTKADSFVREKLGRKTGASDIGALLREVDSEVRLNYAFHSHVLYLLKNMSFPDIILQKYIEYHFKSEGKRITPASIIMEEGKMESFLETNIRTLIVSLRDMNEIDEEHFFEQYSYLEYLLSQDPDGIYAKMDTQARGMYRSVIVKLSLKYLVPEEKIANLCLELAQKGRGDLYHSHHVGAYLLGKGYPVLKARILEKRIPDIEKKKANKKGMIYFTSLMAITICLCLLLLFVVERYKAFSNPVWFLVTLIVVLPLVIGIAIELNNFIFTRIFMVKKIPSLDYICEIPDSARTFVVMPVIVASKEQGMEYVSRLQKTYLANPQKNLYYALLVDYEDSPNQSNPKDKVIEQALVEQVKELNQKYPSEHPIFSLFIRYRKWNESENCYMGWERKRGKLEEFNNLLNGRKVEETSFATILCEDQLLTTFQYVITLDADTNLLRENAAKLVGLIDHPLNRPVIDIANRKVKEGYVIIQPSVRNHIVDKDGSRFTQLFGGQSGLAHYGVVISDIYQDVFNEGIYIGKGIYDVKAFHQLLHNAIPENRVLSHDLLESCFARTAFSSTAKIMDTFPNSVLSFAKREHRWIRGDWQLVPWLFAKSKVNGRGLCALAKWKIFDNLRRSFVPAGKIIFILLNAVLFPRAFYLWIPVVFFSDLFGILVLLFSIIYQRMFRPKLVLVYKGLYAELWIMLERTFMEFTITPYRAYIASDAMLRTLYRIYISKKNLLRWKTAEAVDATIVNTRRGYFLTMWTSLLPATVLLCEAVFAKLWIGGRILFVLVALIWAGSFEIAYAISRPKTIHRKKEQLPDYSLLVETARRTWQFFKMLSVKENHWLCPDNYQIYQVERVSDKTSPTNIGLQFLAILSARDFGFETLSNTIDRIEKLMETVEKLPKWEGHLYNWYHIGTMEVLEPAYISTVDSGNFLGHMVALKHGLLEQVKLPILSETLLQELSFIIAISCPQVNTSDINRVETLDQLMQQLTSLWDSLQEKESAMGGKDNRRGELLYALDAVIQEITTFDLKKAVVSEIPSPQQLAAKANKNALKLVHRVELLCNRIDRILALANFRFLYNERRMLFHIGYHVASQTLDQGCYDLMASESALTSLLAIAMGEIPQKHWFKLGRPLTMVKGIPCFVSWSGTMFEYLMPNLVLKNYEGSIFSETARAAILQQMLYAREANIPWGISESQYYRFDLNSNYQYKAFGVPKIRLQPVRKNSLVVTPYATMLALDFYGEDCVRNLNRLKELGAYGEYGFYEAIDFNLPNAIDLTPYCIVRSYMAHHQGMILVAINNFLHQGIMQERFHSEIMVKAAEVLLEEKRQTHLISLAKHGYTIKISKPLFREDSYSNRYINYVSPGSPILNYLSNNRYSLMITSDGDGFSKYDDIMLYRWRSDVYADTGSYIYIKDLDTGKLWSTTYHPTRTEPEEYRVVFSPHCAEFNRRDKDITTQMIVSLSPDHNMEIRKVNVTNHGNTPRRFELTSYIEMVADTRPAELSHPAFNKLFLESEYLGEHTIFLTRRRGKKESKPPYVVHMVRTTAKLLKQVEHENDRKKFIGRNHSLRKPEAVAGSISFSNQSGFCNDPIMSLRVTVGLAPGESNCISFLTGICDSKEEAIKIGEELNVCYRIDDILEKFRLQKVIELKYLEVSGSQMNAIKDLLSPIYYPSPLYRGPQENVRRNHKNQSSLWRFGISGDNPILLLRVSTIQSEGVIKDVLKAYEYLRMNRIPVDLVILIEGKHGYLEEVGNLITDMTSTMRLYDAGDKPSFFMLYSYQMIPAEFDLLMTVARVVFSEQTGVHFNDRNENQEESIEE